jgi:hypothetical protein
MSGGWRLVLQTKVINRLAFFTKTQTSFVQWIGDRHSMPLPDTTIDRSLTSEVSNSCTVTVKLVQILKEVTAKEHHRQLFGFNSTLFLAKPETPSGEYQHSPPQKAKSASRSDSVLDCFFHS